MARTQARSRAKNKARDAKNYTPLVRSLVMNGEMVLYGVIDAYVYDDYDTTVRAIDVMASLTELSDQERIPVRLNSPGGSVVEGLAIYNILRASGKPIDVHIDAAAFSIASIIAMAGEKIIMAETASMMIHDPWGVAIGGSEEMRRNADEIDRLKAILVGIYASKTGLDRAEIEALMSAETYMTAAEAVENGFADEVENPLAIAAKAPSPLSKAELARFLVPLAPAARGQLSSAPQAPSSDASSTFLESALTRARMRARAAGLLS